MVQTLGQTFGAFMIAWKVWSKWLVEISGRNPSKCLAEIVEMSGLNSLKCLTEIVGMSGRQ
jgi:hypothetical protein